MNRLVNILRSSSDSIHVEITENALLIEQAVLTNALRQLHELGVPVYIDDFGTGFSSLSYLNRFDIDAIKIDRSFVLALESNKGQKIFSSLLGMVDILELDVVVEGVETPEQLEVIPKDKSISVQGWYYSKSLPLLKFIEYYRERHG